MLVVQALSQGMDRAAARRSCRFWSSSPARTGVLARNDPTVRLLEGLEQRVEVLHGDVPERIACARGRSTYDVDPWHGQKTGLFLDQRENREAAALYARGRLLDCFSYHGGFALRLAPACRARGSDRRLGRCGRADHRERAPQRTDRIIEAREANVFDELRHLEKTGERYDTIVLDPPAFAKNKASIAEGARPATRTSTCGRCAC